MFKEYEEMTIKLPVATAFSIVRNMITERTQIVISFFGIERDDYNRVV